MRIDSIASLLAPVRDAGGLALEKQKKIIGRERAYKADDSVITPVDREVETFLSEGIAAEMRPYGVNVCCLCPGSTETEFHQIAGQPPRTSRRRETAEKVARAGLAALAEGRPRVISGLQNRLNAELQRLVPRRLVTRVAARLFAPQTPGKTEAS